MPTLQVALHFPGHWDDEHYLGRSKLDYPSKDSFNKGLGYLVVGVDVDDITARAINLTKRIWGQTCELPPARLDGGGHGENRGIVIKRGISKGVEVKGLEEFAFYDLVTRVSIGGERPKQGEYDLTKPARYHMSVWAGRQFFPVDYKKLGLDETTPIMEIINYSLRWLNGQFDDWSDSKQWNKQLRALDDKCIDEKRTTYAVSDTCMIRTSEGSRRASGSEEDKKLIKKLIDKIGRRHREFPFCKGDPEAYKKPCTETIHARVPILGYREVEWILAGKYMLNPNQHLRREAFNNPAMGIEFLFNDVLCAMERFAKSAERESS